MGTTTTVAGLAVTAVLTGIFLAVGFNIGTAIYKGAIRIAGQAISAAVAANQIAEMEVNRVETTETPSTQAPAKA